MERRKVSKSLNFLGYNEKQVYSKEYMNAIMCSEKNKVIMPIIEERKSFVSAIDKRIEQAYSFSLFEDKISNFMDSKRIQAVANGWFSYIKKLTFKNHDIKGKGMDVEGPCQQLDPNDFPDIKFKYLDQQVIENVTCLDLNSAYLSVLAEGYYPDLDKKREEGIVRSGEIGFTNWTGVLKRVKVGEFADIIFELSYSKELKKWANDKYAHLCLLKSQKKIYEAEAFKVSIVSLTGVIKNHNPYLYVYIVNSCKQKIFELVDENCINVVTDAITFVGKVKPGLDIGTKLGQFKVEYENCTCFRPKLNTNLIIKDSKGNIIKMTYRGGATPKDSLTGFDEANMNYQFRTPKYKCIGDYIYE